MDKETIKYVLAESAQCPLPRAAPRALQLPLYAGKVVTLVGIRRSGKTFLLYETMRRLMAQGVDRRSLLYLNFEDDRLLPIKTKELDLILRAHEELYPELIGQPRYFFFDEVQNAPRWETFVRRLGDTRSGSVFVTGSSSQLLARELATGLRGRSISYEVFPLSFPEFLGFRDLQHVPYSRASDSQMAAALLEYLTVGGLPEVVLANPELRPRILKEYVDLVFYKDLVERYRVSNPLLLRNLLKHCLGNPASLLNVHKLYNDFKSRGFELSKNTLYTYLGYLEESYIAFPLPIADRSIRKQAVNPKKLHAIDWALGYPFVAERTIDIGRKLESAVFLHWRRQREDLAYLGGEREVDLVIGADRPEALINVAWSLVQPETCDREVRSLAEAAISLPSTRKILVAHELSASARTDGVEVIEAWRYLLGRG